MTSSIKPEVHNISPEQDRATAMGDPQMQIGPVVPEIWAQLDRHTDRQTHRQTNKLITILHSPTGAE